nr:uncharacterized protein LOC103419395 [Malus domestica]
MLGEVMEERFHDFSGCFTRQTSTWCISCLKGCDFVNFLLDWCNGLASIFVIQCNCVADIADSTMNGYLEPRRNFNDNQSVGTSGSVSCPITASLNQEDKSKSRKPRLSYAHLHHEITKNINAIPPDSVGHNQKQRISKRKTEEDELIKYMSKLPSYLERGKNLQEKVLNIGVLDWGRLEKWQHSHKQMPYGSSRYSPPSSNTTSCFSTDESSTPSSRGHSCSPA